MKQIPFTFGIITDASDTAVARLSTILGSIHALNIPQYQVLIIGSKPQILHKTTAINSYQGIHMPVEIIDFNEDQKPAWITRKKNLITRFAKYDNIVFQHDYMAYDPEWYKAWQEYGDNYHACMNAIINTDGTRYRDWSLFHSHHFEKARIFSGAQPQECLLPYEETSLSRWMYFSGAYFVAKKKLMQSFPLNERLSWGQGEDCEWSYAVREKHAFSINAAAKVHMLKYNHPIFWPVRPETLFRLKEFAAMEDKCR